MKRMADDQSTAKTTARKLASAAFLTTVEKAYNEHGGAAAFQAFQAAADQDVQDVPDDALAEDLHLGEAVVVMEEDDVQEEEEIDEDDEDEDVGDMEVEEEEVAVVPLQDGNVWKCPLCTVPYAYKHKNSAVRHIASGNHN